MTLLIVSPAHHVAGLVARWQPSHVISLESSTQETVATAFENQRRFSFNDITERRPGLVAPSAEMIGELIDFGRGWDGPRPLLVHCWAGISRSARRPSCWRATATPVASARSPVSCAPARRSRRPIG